MTNKQDLRKAIQEGVLYDYIVLNGYSFSKDELINIIKNLDFTLYQKEDYNESMQQLEENLADYNFFDEE